MDLIKCSSFESYFKTKTFEVFADLGEGYIDNYNELKDLYVQTFIENYKMGENLPSRYSLTDFLSCASSEVVLKNLVFWTAYPFAYAFKRKQLIKRENMKSLFINLAPDVLFSVSKETSEDAYLLTEEVSRNIFLQVSSKENYEFLKAFSATPTDFTTIN